VELCSHHARKTTGNQEPLSAALVSLPKSPGSLSMDQWEIIQDYVPLLKPLELMTEELSAEKCPTLSKVIPLVGGVRSAYKRGSLPQG
jgi:hypothetical protein